MSILLLLASAVLLPQNSAPIRLNFAGDIMLNGVPPAAKPLEGLGPLFATALTFANLEVPLTNAKTLTSRKTAAELKARNQFILCASPLHIQALVRAGVGIVSLANNHAMDHGSEGLQQMIRLLDEAGIHHAGAGEDSGAAQEMTMVVRDGKRIGMVSAMSFLTHGALMKTTPATANSAGVNALDLNGRLGHRERARLREWIGGARRRCDLLVVAVHWGTERKTIPNPYQVSLGRTLVDAGADVVWGNHPHVVQGAEIYHGKPILYSLGNLVSALPSPTGVIQVEFFSEPCLHYFPALIHSGRVRLLPLKARASAAGLFRVLCQQIQLKYSSRASHAPRVL